MAYLRQYGSIPVAFLWLAIVAVLGSVTRALLLLMRLLRAALGCSYSQLRQGMRRKIVPWTVRSAKKVKHMKKELHRRKATAGDAPDMEPSNVSSSVGGSAPGAWPALAGQASGTYGSPHFGGQSSLPAERPRSPALFIEAAVGLGGESLDPLGLTELLLGINHMRRHHGLKTKHKSATTRVLCSRVPILNAAAMPTNLLYLLSSSPQVNSELFCSPLMRAVITFRWQHFARYYLLLQMLEHLLFTVRTM